MPNLKMLTGLCGPDYSLVRGDEREFDEREASSLIRAGFAVATDGFEPVEEETEADAAAKAEAEAADAAEAEAAAEAKAEADAEKAAAKPATAKSK